MKALPRLLSCLLVTSVAMLNAGAAWSDTPAKTSQAQTPGKAKVKRARLARAASKHVVKPNAPRAAMPVKTAAMAPERAEAPIARADENPYAAGAVAVAKASVVNPYLPAPSTPAMNLTLSKSLAAPATLVAPTPPVTTVVAPVADRSVAVTAAASPVKQNAAAVPPVTVDAASERAWAKIAAGPAAAPATPAYAPAYAAVPNPYLAYRTSLVQTTAPQAPVAASPAADPARMLGSLRDLLPEPHLPSADIDILPSITKVYPTGERPMYVLTFKCPTELVGITPPPTKALRWLITGGMDAVNSTNLLPFSMQQVCQ